MARQNHLLLDSLFIDQTPPDNVPYNDEDSDDEEGFRLEDISSDVEVPADELDSDEEEAA